MAKINNSEVIQKLVDELKLYPGKDLIPTELAEKILPVFQINTEEISLKTPTANVVQSNVADAGAAVTIYTTPSTGAFYLTNVSATITPLNALAGVQTWSINIDIDGATQNILRGRCEGTNAEAKIPFAVTLNLQNPVLIDPGTTIQVVSGHANLPVEASIVGYTE